MKKKRIYVIMTLVLLFTVGAAAFIYILKSPFEAKRSPVSETVRKGAAEKMTEVDREKLVPETAKPKGIKIAIDPGHQGPHVDMSAQEENAPGSGVMKQKATSGTTGTYTGLGEYELNLDIALKVRDRLEKLGYEVVMAREDNDTAISNKERAQMANEAGADVCVRIHANGSESPSSEGALCLVMSQDNPYVGQLYGESSRPAGGGDHFSSRALSRSRISVSRTTSAGGAGGALGASSFLRRNLPSSRIITKTVKEMIRKLMIWFKKLP